MSSIFSKKDIYPDAKTAFNFSLRSLDELKDNCLFVLDANVLLLPFTTDGKSLYEIKRIYQILVTSERLFIPAQAVREYLDNRATKLTETYKSISDKSSQNFKFVCPHPLLSGMDEYAELEQVERELKESIKKYQKELKKVLASIKSWGWDDPVSKMYHEVLQDTVLDDAELNLSEIKVDLERRNKLKIPPGYKDGGKDDNQAGDLLIWNEIINLAKSKEKDVVFVSGDNKADWWHKSDKKGIYPRFELVDEFRESTGGKSFHIVSLSQLLSTFDASDESVTAIKSSESESVATETEQIVNEVDRSPLKKKFGIPDKHELKKVTYNVKSGMSQEEDWTFHELNESGELVSIIEYWNTTSIVPPFDFNAGYKKYDLTGKIISSAAYKI
ncbi:PIN domain-containing protein [Colwellia sp. 75C3]|uniref:PIN domain-containing protein n=1 Tax=Colwellia sp. 75C3 TaxID=888425 RepID=UPI000C325FF6|nr:PIN domain-containing protein [Colwellia sp. 75C3]